MVAEVVCLSGTTRDTRLLQLPPGLCLATAAGRQAPGVGPTGDLEAPPGPAKSLPVATVAGQAGFTAGRACQ